MAVTRGQPVLQDDLDALAALANANLLPLVNAAVAASTWPGHQYDIYDPTLKNPQPNYSFDPGLKVIARATIVDGGEDYQDGDVLTVAGGTLEAGYSAAQVTVITTSAGKITGLNDTGLNSVPASSLSRYSGAPATPNAVTGGHGSGALIALTFASNWLSELNRIRGDYWNLIFGDPNSTDYAEWLAVSDWSTVFRSDVSLVSGPWVVGVNDPALWPNNGILLGALYAGPYYAQQLTGFCAFKNVSFLYAAADAPGGVQVTGEFPEFPITLTTTDESFTTHVKSSVNGVAEIDFKISISKWGSSAGPDPEDLAVLASAGGVGVVLESFSGAPDYVAIYDVVVSGIDVGTSAFDFSADFTLPAGWTFGGFSSPTCQMEFSSSATAAATAGLHPESDIMKLDCATDPPNAAPMLMFSADTVCVGAAQWRLSDASVKGVWTAKTLPLPGQNVFLDADLPPYVGQILGSEQYGFEIPVAVTANLPQVSHTINYGGDIIQFIDNPPDYSLDNTAPLLLSSMRQQAQLLHGSRSVSVGGVPVNLGPAYNLINQSGQCRPAPWLVRRDTDAVPFNFGYNNADSEQIYSNITAQKNGVLWIGAAGIVAAGVTGIRIRLVAANTGTKTWEGGELVYGQPLGTPLNIYVCLVGHGAPGPTNKDFATANNAVNIDGTRQSDGGRTYLAQIKATQTFVGFNFAIENPTADDVQFDLIVEFDYAQNPKRQFFPSCYECSGLSLDGTPAGGYVYYEDYSAFKPPPPVPQSGYCIFKVRATRLPVQDPVTGISKTPATGLLPEVKLTLGQNRLGLDGKLTFAPFIGNLQSPGAGDTDTLVSFLLGASDGGGAGGSGTPYTLTIPANARDSGDVDVFIPVLGGNELVYQLPPMTLGNCLVNAPGLGYVSGQILVPQGGVLAVAGAYMNITVDSTDAEGRVLASHVSSPGAYLTPPPAVNCPVSSNGGTGATFDLTLTGAANVILEAWANWQPKFHSNVYGLRTDAFGAPVTPQPTAFQFCGAFVNWTRPTDSNFGFAHSEVTPNPRVQFPLSKEIYNDLEACLNLL